MGGSMVKNKKFGTKTLKYYQKELPTLGKKIREARKAKHITQSQLAQMIGLSDKSISAIEVGRTEPSITKMQAIASVLGKSLNYFSTDQDRYYLLEKKIDQLIEELLSFRGKI